MSAVLQPDHEPALRALAESDLDAVLALEQQVYEFPWTRGNFADGLASGYPALVLATADQLLGYAVAMVGFEEMHLLNLTVAPQQQRRGHGLQLLDAVLQAAGARGCRLLWLEVRVSNARARALYQRYGFRAVGSRRGYYPDRGADGRPAREDAVVMSAEVAALARQRGLPA